MKVKAIQRPTHKVVVKDNAIVNILNYVIELAKLNPDAPACELAFVCKTMLENEAEQYGSTYVLIHDSLIDGVDKRLLPIN